MSKIKKIDPSILYRIITEGQSKEVIDGYKLVQSTLLSSDDEDGGGEYELVIQEIKSKKYYALTYTDWDIENTDYDEDTQKVDDRCDLPDEIVEVKPTKKTITIYKQHGKNKRTTY